MTRSMTAFAREQVNESWGQYSWELRSLNHRYQNLHIHLPEEFRALEPTVRERIETRVARGKVECTLRFQYRVERAAGLELDTERLDRLADACTRIQAHLPELAGADPMRVLDWPGIVREVTPSSDEHAEEVLALLDKVLAALDEARRREGESLAGFIRTRITTLEEYMGSVRERLPQIRKHFRTRLERRLEQFTVEADPGRLEQEMAILANRSDVDEELDRLSTHLDALRSTLEQDKPKGRRLDFQMQECNREVNTIASKIQDVEITSLAVDMKVAVEQIREQVQNIE